MTDVLKHEANVWHSFGQRPPTAVYLGFFNTCFSSQGSQPHGAPVPGEKKKIKGHIYIFPLYLHKSNVVASVGCLCDGTKRETIHSQFPYLIIRERAEHLCVTCFGIVAFLASGTACGAVRLTWICGRGKMPQADRNWKQDYIQAEPNKWCIIFRNIEILNRALSWAADWLHMVFSDVGG